MSAIPHLNVRLIATLAKVTRMTNQEISDATEIPIATWYRIAAGPANISVQQLMQLANGLKIPVRKFFTEGEAVIVGIREDYIRRDYKECRYDGDALRDKMGRGTSIGMAEAAKAMSIDISHITKYIRAEKRLTVASLLSFCEAFNIDPFTFIIDPNPVEAAPHRKRSGPSDGQSALTEELAAIRQELAQLREDYNKLKEANNLLARKLAEREKHPGAHRPYVEYGENGIINKLPKAAEGDKAIDD